jgi:hypothetical protein
MTAVVQLNEMSVSEKIGLMEEIWDDLARNVPAYSPPDWHMNVLSERKALQEAGEVGFTDWDQAKKEIREHLA